MRVGKVDGLVLFCLLVKIMKERPAECINFSIGQTTKGDNKDECMNLFSLGCPPPPSKNKRGATSARFVVFLPFVRLELHGERWFLFLSPVSFIF